MNGSYRQILRSSSIIGGASVIAIGIGLIRNKAAAILLGPEGVGLIGLLQNIMMTAATVAGLGLSNVGTRQIAEAEAGDDLTKGGEARFALRTLTVLLAIVGGLVFLQLRQLIAIWVLGDKELSSTVAWLSVGVAFTVAAGSQGALLAGLRRIGDLARLSIYSGLLSSALGVGCLYFYGRDALILFVLTVPLCGLFFGHFFVSRIPPVGASKPSAAGLMNQWGKLIRLGTSFMLAGVVATLAQLLVRSMVNRQLGSAALGQFEAAWIVSMTYIGFVLKAMGTDYYPRLTASIKDASMVNRMVNEQTEVALLLAGPLFLIMLGCSPWLMTILYSAEFSDATNILRWQVLGDILKVASWPLGFIILAAGEGRTFVISESIAMTTFVAMSWIGLPLIGLQATGISFLLMYVVLLPLVYWLAWRKTRFRWSREVVRILCVLFVACVVTAIVAAGSRLAGCALGTASAIVFGMSGLAHLGRLIELPGPLATVSVWLRKKFLPRSQQGPLK